MLIGSYRLLLDDPAGFVRLVVLLAFSLVVAITVHEFSHALMATGLGDQTAKRLGRLTLNPVKHLDPGGTVMLLVAGFGWGKPVPVNPQQLRSGRLGMAMVAGAGPLSNLVVAFLLAIPIKVGILFGSQPGLNQIQYVMTGGIREGLSDIFGLVIFFNLLLAVFNLIPLYPLDGAKVLAGLLPEELAVRYSRLEPLGPLILVGVILADYAFGWRILWSIIGPVVRGLTAAATGY
jgi:Zn-dependent protease